MKTPVIIAFIVLLFNTAYSQTSKDVTWLDVSLKGGFGLSILKNFNISNDDRVNMESFNQNQFLGIKIGTTTAENYGVYIESDYNNFNQKYNVLPPDNPQFNKTIYFQSLENSLMFRYCHFTGAFIEAGAKYSLLLGAKAFYSDINQELDEKANYKTSYMSLAVGAGLKIYQSNKDRYRINLFTRISYGLTELMKDPTVSPIRSLHYNVSYTTPAKTTPFFLQFGAEFTFYAGYRSAVGNKRNIFGTSAWHFGN